MRSGTQAGLGIYPFMEGKLEDLEEVFDHFKTVSPPEEMTTQSLH